VTDVTFVVDSEVKGPMGRDLIGFGEEADAESFQSEFGGSLTGHNGVTPEVVAGLGM
jgi:nitrous oxide reductase accessory protein NosL